MPLALLIILKVILYLTLIVFVLIYTTWIYNWSLYLVLSRRVDAMIKVLLAIIGGDILLEIFGSKILPDLMYNSVLFVLVSGFSLTFVIFIIMKRREIKGNNKKKKGQ